MPTDLAIGIDSVVTQLAPSAQARTLAFHREKDSLHKHRSHTLVARTLRSLFAHRAKLLRFVASATDNGLSVTVGSDKSEYTLAVDGEVWLQGGDEAQLGYT